MIPDILTKAFSNLDKNVANAIAIIAAVLVAYITNKDLVFHSEAKGFNEKFYYLKKINF